VNAARVKRWLWDAADFLVPAALGLVAAIIMLCEGKVQEV
jgi:hypothetical protein